MPRARAAVRRRSALGGAVLCCLLALCSTLGAASARAEPVGWVEGTVRAEGKPVANAWVAIMPVNPAGSWAGTPVQTTTDREGRYRVAGLQATHVKVHVRAPVLSGLADSYWPDAYAFATAGRLRVAPSGSTADLELPVGSSIGGRVVDADTGAPIAGAQVLAHVEAPPGWEPVGRPGLATGPGQFAIADLPPVPVSLQVRPPEGTNHLAQWYDGVGFHGAATVVSPGATGIVIRLREGAEVGGAVRDDEGRGVADAAVTIIGCPALCPLSARTDASGVYRIRGVPPGVGLRAHVDAAGDVLLDRWYTAAGQTGDTSFDLTTGQVRQDLDVTLTSGAVVLGRAVDSTTGQPIAGVTFELVDVDNPLRSHLSRAVRAPDAPTALVVSGAPAEPQTTPDPAPSDPPPAQDSGGADVVVGPVPPGVYTLVVHPGSRNTNYLPISRVASAGTDATGRVALARGERARITVALARQRMVPRADGVEVAGWAGGDAGPGAHVPSAQSGPVNPEVWPGLFRGFLAPRDGSPGLGS